MENIIFVIPGMGQGGAERVISILADEASQTHAVKIVVFESIEPATISNVPIININIPSSTSKFFKFFNIIRRSIRLKNVLIANSPVRIISFTEGANFPTIIASLLCSMLHKTIVSVRTNPNVFDIYSKLLCKILYRLPYRVVANSSQVTKIIIDKFKLPPHKCITIYNPVSRAATISLENLATAPYFLSVGRLSPEKGFDILIKSFARALKTIDSAQLIICGDGPCRTLLEDLTRQLGIAKHVQFKGTVLQPDSYYRHAYCLIHTSWLEGWPNVINEALSWGVPVIASDCDYGPREIVKDGVNGYLVKPGSIEKFADTICKMMQQPAVRKSMSLNATASVADFSVSSIWGSWLS